MDRLGLIDRQEVYGHAALYMGRVAVRLPDELSGTLEQVRASAQLMHILAQADSGSIAAMSVPVRVRLMRYWCVAISGAVAGCPLTCFDLDEATAALKVSTSMLAISMLRAGM